MANEPYPLRLGRYTRTITVAEPLANEWFQRGLNWMFDFHHEEAIKCFQCCLDVDPACVMAHWGIAYSNGPNYNFYRDVGYYVLSGSPDAVFPSQKMAVAALAKAIEQFKALGREIYKS